MAVEMCRLCKQKEHSNLSHGGLMTDNIKRDQEVIALRQLIEQTYANHPAIQDALRRNADEFDLQLGQLPSGTSPAGARETGIP
jgi:hypothetical protein